MGQGGRGTQSLGIPERNMGFHHLGSHGYAGKRSIWAKEDTKHESLGILDPLVEFTVPRERDIIRVRFRWDPVKKVFEIDAVTTEFMRLLVIFNLPLIFASDQFDCMFSHICKRSLLLLQKEQHRIAAKTDSPSEALVRSKWDTPFNRALNILKGLLVDTRPSYGRVHGIGDGATWKEYYRETTEERKERRRLTEEIIDKKVEIAVEKKSSEIVATVLAAAK